MSTSSRPPKSQSLQRFVAYMVALVAACMATSYIIEGAYSTFDVLNQGTASSSS